jgi:hypothetical protein
MSLINDALKKAQCQHSQPPFGSTPPIPSETAPSTHTPGHIRKRDTPMAAQTMVLVGAGAVLLIVISVVATVFLVNRTPSKPVAPTTVMATKTPALAPAPKIEPIVTTPEAPTVAPFVITAAIPPAAEKRAEPLPVALASGPAATTPAETRPPLAKAAPANTAPVASTHHASEIKPAASVAAPVPEPTTTAGSANHGERVHAFLDAIRLKGVKASGADSRVLMNEHVYRLNDLVDRGLGLRLTKVEVGKLTFTDAAGVVYEKTY